MIKKFLNDALKDPSVVKKLKELGYKPEDIKSKKSLLAIIKSDKRFDVLQMSIVSKKYKRGPGGGGGEPRISKFDLILKRLDTMDNRLVKVEDFIVEQRKFNAKQEQFNEKVVETFGKIDLRFNALENKLSNFIEKTELRFDALENKLSNVIEKNNLKV